LGEIKSRIKPGADPKGSYGCPLQQQTMDLESLLPEQRELYPKKSRDSTNKNKNNLITHNTNK